MNKRIIDVLNKHKEAIDDLTQVGAISPAIQARMEIWERRQRGERVEEIAEATKFGRRNVYRILELLKMEL